MRETGSIEKNIKWNVEADNGSGQTPNIDKVGKGTRNTRQTMTHEELKYSVELIQFNAEANEQGVDRRCTLFSLPFIRKNFLAIYRIYRRETMCMIRNLTNSKTDEI